jgi:serine/threonine-protein kinase
MTKASDRNLLVGVLALQMDFIDRDQLIAAMHAWVLEKSKSLDEVLLEQRALAEDARVLLVAMVNKHIELHDGDAEKSLASVSSLGSVREDLRKLNDPQLEATLAGVATGKQETDLCLTETLVLGRASSAGDRFRVLRPHAEGGLGEVSVARDEELHREVALKTIRERFAHDAQSRARFVLEAEITGSLEHPGIVPVYGLGQYGDGRPFYAMRFIRGDSLRNAADRFHRGEERRERGRGLAFRQLLGRFVDVCQAVEYAHSRGVLHRDLKPGNIMLGKYGETLVVDWGLAKTVGRQADHRSSGEKTLEPFSASGSTATQVGSVVGTPAFMSPEQAEGKLDQLSPRTDVYSLGATLYYVLTGEPPVNGKDHEEVMRRVREGDIRPPREICPSLPKGLAAICRKAMAREMADRYVSARSLAEDVERWLADEAVAARPDTVAEKIGRWTRRHRSAAAVGAISFVLITAILVSSLVTVLRQRDAALEAQREADAAARKAELAKADAEAATARAQQSAATAREVVDHFLIKIGDDQWSGIPHAESMRIEMVEQAIARYQQMLDESPNDLDLIRDTAMAFRRCGNLYRMVNEFAEARELYQRSRELYDDAVARRPDNADLARARLELLLDAVDVARDGQVAAAPEIMQIAAAAQQLRERFPDRPSIDKVAARAHLTCSSLMRDVNEMSQAKQTAQEAAETFSRYAAENPQDIVARLSAVVAWTNLARIAHDANDQKLADRASAEAVTRSRSLLPLSPLNANLRFVLGSALIERARARAVTADALQEAHSLLNEGVDILQKLAEENVQTASFRRRWAEGLTLRCRLLLAAEDSSAATSDGARATKILDALSADSASAAKYAQQLAVALTAYGNALRADGDSAAAPILARAREMVTDVLPRAPGNRELREAADTLERVLKIDSPARLREGER